MGVFKAGSGGQRPDLQARVEQAKAEARRQRAESEAEKMSQIALSTAAKGEGHVLSENWEFMEYDELLIQW